MKIHPRVLVASFIVIACAVVLAVALRAPKPQGQPPGAAQSTAQPERPPFIESNLAYPLDYGLQNKDPREAFLLAKRTLDDLQMGQVVAHDDSMLVWYISMEGSPYYMAAKFMPLEHGSHITITTTQPNADAAKVAEKNWLTILLKGMQ